MWEIITMDLVIRWSLTESECATVSLWTMVYTKRWKSTQVSPPSLVRIIHAIVILISAISERNQPTNGKWPNSTPTNTLTFCLALHLIIWKHLARSKPNVSDQGKLFLFWYLIIIITVLARTNIVNVGDDCPVFEGLFEYCGLSAGGSMGMMRLISACFLFHLTEPQYCRGRGTIKSRSLRYCHQLGWRSASREKIRSLWILLCQRYCPGNSRVAPILSTSPVYWYRRPSRWRCRGSLLHHRSCHDM